MVEMTAKKRGEYTKMRVADKTRITHSYSIDIATALTKRKSVPSYINIEDAYH